MKKNIFITGGSGLIGQALIKKINTNFNITILTRDINRCKQILKSHNHIYIDSLDKLDSLEHFDAVINLAGESISNKRWSDNQKNTICQSRWQITQNLVERIQKSNKRPKIFISASAIGFYGRQPNNTQIDESCIDCFNEFTHKVCSKWETIAQQVSSITRVVILRTGIVLSKKGGILNNLEPPIKIGLGACFGDGKQIMSWIHIDDVVNAIIFLLNNKQANGPFNLTAPNPVSNKYFIKELAKSMHRPAFFKIPKFVNKVIFGEMSDLFLYGQYVKPTKLLKANFSFEYPLLVDALKSLYK